MSDAAKKSADAKEDTGRALISELPTVQQPTTSFAPVVASEVAEEKTHTVHDVIEEWFQRHFHGLGPHLTEFMHAKLYAAKEELKQLIQPVPHS